MTKKKEAKSYCYQLHSDFIEVDVVQLDTNQRATMRFSREDLARFIKTSLEFGFLTKKDILNMLS